MQDVPNFKNWDGGKGSSRYGEGGKEVRGRGGQELLTYLQGEVGGAVPVNARV